MKNNIATIRKSKGLSQKELAELVSISHWWMNNIENNKKNPSLKLAKNIADVLGVKVKDIFLE